MAITETVFPGEIRIGCPKCKLLNIVTEEDVTYSDEVKSFGIKAKCWECETEFPTFYIKLVEVINR